MGASAPLSDAELRAQAAENRLQQQSQPVLSSNGQQAQHADGSKQRQAVQAVQFPTSQVCVPVVDISESARSCHLGNGCTGAVSLCFLDR